MSIRLKKRIFSAAPLLLAVAMLLVVGACEDAGKDTILDPTGGSAKISGVLTFNGQGGTDRPVATIYALGGYDETCATGYSTIHIMGTFNDWNEDLWITTPGMEYLGGCTWVELLSLVAGPINWKFVTNGAWDNPPDYVSTGSGDGLVGDLQAGSGGDLGADVPETGDYYALLFEGTDPPSYIIATGEDAPIVKSDPVTGAFEILNLLPGTYEIIIVAGGYITTHISDVFLDAKTESDLGTIDIISPSGAIAGVVAFEDSPDPMPTATIQVHPAGGSALVATDSTDAEGNFSIEGLLTGHYDLSFSASGYETLFEYNVEFINGQDTDMGTVLMHLGCSTAYTMIEVMGEFNGWAPLSSMDRVGSCLWRDTIAVAAEADTGSVWLMKFRTNGVWETPPDFGTCTTQDEIQGLTGDVCLVTGAETALSVRFPESGLYEFTLNEAIYEYSITRIGEIVYGSISGTIAFEDDPVELPMTTVTVYPANSPQAVAQVLMEEDGSFLVQDLVPGNYVIIFQAVGYIIHGLEDVVIVGDQNTDIGQILMAPEGECVPVSSIELVGEFNNWPAPGQGPFATYKGNCIWADTLAINIASDQDSTYIMKFRTDRTWDPSYGSCSDYGGESFVFVFTGGQVSGGICMVSGQGTGITIKYPATGNYRFEVNERTKMFTIQLLN
ncbi:MAG: carboxypeptidase-like regulatory domain-containing protein [Candidatus Eisenbacteria bacterium]|uniref:Carboxypeptidase-like regulatory domain-containing protein n=1 Tax=Eiseniibacteriota bacterium TaxID=2212470 RepID=A0A948WBM6_UNCEI|nr:carboxypeptidase-like regulatory domain-containing protein [Candidatus Eisenbacteria bacterium]MBU1950446.1 carboxypeptidase-like regulatory domain-containing protein [Candidatus Eisenbacteria bacterium]MBU2690113.1 carboxypeptidase-like regulatory domain-containing protein [Candidatus Eisenbacteria bacterium]